MVIGQFFDRELKKGFFIVLGFVFVIRRRGYQIFFTTFTPRMRMAALALFSAIYQYQNLYE
jgi:hypothetical protein